MRLVMMYPHPPPLPAMTDASQKLPSSDLRILIQGAQMSNYHSEALAAYAAHGGDPAPWALPTAGNTWALIALRHDVPEFAVSEGARLIDKIQDDALARQVRLGSSAAVLMMAETLRDPHAAFLRWIASAHEYQQRSFNAASVENWEEKLWAATA